MNFVSVGDLSRFFAMRRANSGLRNDIQRLSEEVTTGLKADIPKHLKGDLIEIAQIERGLSEASAYRRVASEAASTATGMQAALGTMQDIADSLSGDMLADTSLAVQSSLQSLATTVASQLDTAISALNSNVGGRFIFSGTKVNTPPLVSSDELLAQAEAVPPVPEEMGFDGNALLLQRGAKDQAVLDRDDIVVLGMKKEERRGVGRYVAIG